MGRDLLALFVLFILLIAGLMRDNILLPLVLFSTFLGALILRKKHHRSRELIVNQLKSYRKELREGQTVQVGSTRFRYDTILATFHMTIGGLISSVEIPSIYRKATGEEQGEAMLYSIVSLIAGWWALPFGPLTTISFIASNLSGGKRITVKELIDGVKNEPMSEPKPKKKKPKEVKEEPPEAPTQFNTGPDSPSAKLLKKKQL